jgi:choline dehydrogenase-like flavoprotein
LFPGTIAHYGGTARMHAQPEYGVVDAWNRVYDAPNVLVCDAACFTTAAEKNPTLTVMAIATRAAARLAGDLKHA